MDLGRKDFLSLSLSLHIPLIWKWSMILLAEVSTFLKEISFAVFPSKIPIKPGFGVN